MIRINLIDPDARMMTGRTWQWSGTGAWPGALLALCLGIATAGFWYSLTARAAALAADVAEAEALHARLSGEVEAVAALDVRRAGLAAAVDLADRIRSSRFVIVDLLETVRGAVPGDVRLVALRQHASVVELGGRARSVGQVSEFADALAGSGSPAAAVEVTSVSREGAGPESEVTFDVRITIEVADAEAAAAGARLPAAPGSTP